MHSYKVQEKIYERPSQSNYDLKVFQRAYAISPEIYKTSHNFPKEERYAITDQIRRASSSICANIAEGYGRQMTSNAEFKRFLVIAKGSCHEVGVWIDYCLDLGFIGKECHHKWQNEYLEISKMLFGLTKTL
ncbi:MAG: four helix bundle protein [Alphaproteobacteria bacterium]|nr:four helix bundle protein [Alphaproteobacteria bacterium]